MARDVALFATVVTGGLVALQAPINHSLRTVTGPWQAATLSFAVGTFALLVILLLFGGGFGPYAGVARAPWYYLIGGLMGAAYVTTAMITVKTLGVGGVTAATIAGQLAVSVIADRIGVLGLERVPITWHRLLGVALLAVGTWLIVRH